MNEIEEFIELKTKVYYVYHCFVDGNLRYIGMGKGDRYKHCNSGKSSCAELNRDFLEDRKIDVQIIAKGLSKDEAVWTEISEINSNKDKGIYNKHSKTSPFTTYPSCERISDFKVKKGQKELDVIEHLCKISPNMEKSKYDNLKKALHNIDLDFYVGKIGTTQVLVIDKYDTRKFDIHLGCPNWPNCDEIGCGR